MGAIIHLEINVVGTSVSNDGSVVCSEANSYNCIFTTIEAAGDWNHPVSENRQIGYFYNPFEKADDLWRSFQSKTNSFINQNGGNSTIQEPVDDNRPDWENVKEVLMENKPISNLGCD